MKNVWEKFLNLNFHTDATIKCIFYGGIYEVTHGIYGGITMRPILSP